MENNKEMVLAKQSNQTLAFVEEQMQSLDKAMEFCDKMVQSRVLPKHYYNDNGVPKPESSGMLLVVLQMGKEIGMTQMQAIQQIIPVNGLMSIKGDGAKALIMASGKCAAWREIEEGEGDARRVTIYSKRKDNGEEITRSFSVEDAKRAGLWIDLDAVKRNDRLKYSPWFKYGARMLRYRALGFIARDLYSDVLQGIYVEEEARDIDNDITRTQTDNGMVINANETNRQANLENAAIKSTKSSKVVKKEEVVAPKNEIQDVEFVEVTQEEPQKEEPIVVEEEIDELMQHKCAYVPFAKLKDLLVSEKESCKEWIGNMLKRHGISSMTALFNWLGLASNINNTQNLVLALRENNLEVFVTDAGKDGINIDEINAKEATEAKKEKPVVSAKKNKVEIDIPELVMGERDFNEQFTLQQELKNLGFTSAKVEGYLEGKNIQMNFAEFIAKAPSDLILDMINL